MMPAFFAYLLVGLATVSTLSFALPIPDSNNLPSRASAMQAGQVNDSHGVSLLQVGSREVKREGPPFVQNHGLPAPAMPVKSAGKNGEVSVDWNWSLSTQF